MYTYPIIHCHTQDIRGYHMISPYIPAASWVCKILVVSGKTAFGWDFDLFLLSGVFANVRWRCRKTNFITTLAWLKVQMMGSSTPSNWQTSWFTTFHNITKVFHPWLSQPTGPMVALWMTWHSAPLQADWCSMHVVSFKTWFHGRSFWLIRWLGQVVFSKELFSDRWLLTLGNLALTQLPPQSMILCKTHSLL